MKAHRFLMAALLLLAPLSARAEVFVQPIQALVNDITEVAPKTYQYYELPLSAGAELAVEFVVEGGSRNSIDVALLDETNFQRFQAGQEHSVFEVASGRVEASATYTFIAPVAGSYYIVLDNGRARTLSRTVKTSASALSDAGDATAREIKKYYGALYNDLLKVVFEFPDFDIYVAVCGEENAYSTPDIVMCYELDRLLFSLGVPEASLFVFFHEAAHSLLYLWDYPLYDNEDAADELATVLLIALEDKESARAAARWWAYSASEEEALAKLNIDSRHSLSPQRARNIMNWIDNEDELLRRWMNLLAPKMTEENLEANLSDPKYEDAAREELTKRRLLRESRAPVN